MRKSVEAILQDMGNIYFNERFYHGDRRFSLKASDYRIFSINTLSDKFTPPEGLIFYRDYNNYALVLTAPRKGKLVNAAMVGFNVEDDILDCVYFAGGRKRYRELCPVKWDVGLCQHVIDIANEADAKAVHVVPGHLVQSSKKFHGSDRFSSHEGNDPVRHGRLNKRYDSVAKYHGMKYDAEADRYVMSL